MILRSNIFQCVDYCVLCVIYPIGGSEYSAGGLHFRYLSVRVEVGVRRELVLESTCLGVRGGDIAFYSTLRLVRTILRCLGVRGSVIAFHSTLRLVHTILPG